MARVTDRWSEIPAGVPGGYSPIPDINDRHVQELGGWAVSEHVKKANDGLKFNKVVSGDVQVVSGLNYRLIIDASGSNGKDAKYEAVVWERDWTNTRQLLSFKPAN
ncbi:Cysteine proteinase inhibitor 8 [Dichanthelium oligosanthes]|uniref:Cysteine proteinase inhibitor 8 n=1 Tax=Dichanthelium oligosanthes TaxID=888268 RepID=A0A1E5W8H9_9POAL|nr:Cysteine proteinase inhibitor 8 [Dichanthelium oligosanthes]